jgi:hypothetical protein
MGGWHTTTVVAQYNRGIYIIGQSGPSQVWVVVTASWGREWAGLDFDPERYDCFASESWHQADALEQIDQIR